MNYHLQRMTASDSTETIDWITRQYGFDRNEVESWVEYLHFNWPLSVKAVDNNGKTIGMLNMSDYRIDDETEQIRHDNPELLAKLNALKYTSVFPFIVKEEYRGTRLNYDMIQSIIPELQQYDFVFIPVMHHLKTHQYWQRWGAREFYRNKNCVYYLLPMQHHFTAVIERSGDLDAAYVRVPIDIRAVYGKGRLKVNATFDGESYRGSVVNMGVTNPDGSICYIIGIPKAVRKKTGKSFGDTIEVTLYCQG